MKSPSVSRPSPTALLAVASTLALVVAWVFPLGWALAKTILPPEDGSWLDVLDLYRQVLFGTSIGRWFVNSLVTAGGVTLTTLAISSACGYAISQIGFTGRKLLWIVSLASFMIPTQALIVNHFFLMSQWKLTNNLIGVILPQLIAPIAVIIYKQFFDRIPRELSEAALIDGARHWEIFLRIYLPLNWGITSALAIVLFIGSWNTFLWPFLVITKPDLMNVTVGAVSIRWNTGELATALLTAFPLAVVYLFFQRKVTEAIMLSAGIKG